MAAKNFVGVLRKELLTRRGAWPALAKKSGGAISYRWIIEFASGRLKDPGGGTLAALAKTMGMTIAVGRA